MKKFNRIKSQAEALSESTCHMLLPRALTRHQQHVLSSSVALLSSFYDSSLTIIINKGYHGRRLLSAP
ncbi:hypothetical protein I312_101691 [Cryptococcus bacillisporus CA1280]|uniref:uncharacterized protein n=1 Tax=Cryptococcus bacillisporus CA1280 TaxID=1296109 RepID=UPI003367EE60